jgi:hypothetical protein
MKCHKEMEEDFFAAYRVEKTVPYRIKPGDNVWALCQEQFDLPLWLLKKYNSETDLARLSPPANPGGTGCDEDRRDGGTRHWRRQ